MASYILKRLLLMIPTLIGVMLVTFTVTQFVPGGPVEQLISQLEGSNASAGEVSSSSSGLYRGDKGLEQEHVDKLKALYGFDKPAYQRFFNRVSSPIFILVEIFERSARFFLKPISVPSGVSTGQNLP